MVVAQSLPDSHPAAQYIEPTKKLLELLQKEPQLVLQYKEFKFIRDYLRVLGVQVPEPESEAATEKEQSSEKAAEPEKQETTSSSEESEEEEEEEEESEQDEEDPEVVEDKEEESTFPEVPTGSSEGEVDWEKLGDVKGKASEALASGDVKKAIELYTDAIKMQPSALTYAKRAECLRKEKRFNAAIRDCNLALEQNPDSAKAMKIRGKAQRFLGNWEEAAKDLRRACQIDFDADTEEVRREVEKHIAVIEKKKTRARVKERKAKEKELKRRLKERKKAQEKARREKYSSPKMPGANPTGGMPGGMPGMPPGGMPPGMEGLMAQLLSDPELAAGLQNPKILAALQGGMSDPSKMAEMMKDPEVAAFYQKLMAKMGPMGAGAGMGAGGMGGGAPGGMGGGAPGGMGGFGGGNPMGGFGGGIDADEVD